MNKFNPKTAFVIILSLIFIVGLFLLFKTPKLATNGTTQTDKGFLSFFGDRKLKTVDETTVPSANSNNKYNPDGTLNPNYDPTKDATDDNSSNSTGGTGSNGSGSNGSGTGGAGNDRNASGTFSIKSIGKNVPGSGGGGINPGGGGGIGPGTGIGGDQGINTGNCYDGIKNGDETGIDTGGRCSSGVGDGNCYDGVKNGNEKEIDIGGRCDNGNNPGEWEYIDGVWTYDCPASNPSCKVVDPIETVDCTPPKLPYTQTEIDQLKVLVARFYNIAANLKTQSDIQNEIDTRASYIELINQAKEYTNQCVAQIKAVQAGTNYKLSDGTVVNLKGKAIDIYPKWNPYLPKNLADNFPINKNVSDGAQSQIKDLKNQLDLYNAQVKFLKEIGTKNPITGKTKSYIINGEEQYLGLSSKQRVLLTKTLPALIKETNDKLIKAQGGSFFPELGMKKTPLGERIYKFSDLRSGSVLKSNVYKSYFADDLKDGTGKQLRINDDWDRRSRIFFMIKQWILDYSDFYTDDNSQPWAIFYFFQGNDYASANNPLQWLLDDLPHSIGAPNDDPNASGVHDFHILQQVEDALGIW